MADVRTTIDYASYTKSQLQLLIKDRTGKFPKRHLPRKTYLDRLHQLDGRSKRDIFPFLDLPAELRSEIYRELLILRPSKLPGRQRRYPSKQRVCWPEILCVSKAVRAEADEVLYGENDFEIKISGQQGFAGYSIRWYHVSLICEGRVYGGFPARFEHRLTWPSYLKRVLNLTVIIDLKNHEETSDTSVHRMFEHVHKRLHSLSSKLSAEGRLKTVHVQVCAKQSRAYLDVRETMLWPLVKFSGPTVLSISLLWEPLRRALINRAKIRQRSEADAFNKAWHLREEARSMKQLMESAGVDDIPSMMQAKHDFGARLDIPHITQAKKDLLGCLDVVDAILSRRDYMNDDSDALLAKSVHELQTLLSDDCLTGQIVLLARHKRERLDRGLERFEKSPPSSCHAPLPVRWGLSL